ncbi:MAG TPA: metallophosphoesterase [Atopostipes sp.]|nr:metallophosphoesterase [Atopostipes sp.]
MKKKWLIRLGLILFLIWMIWGNLSIAITHFTISNNRVPDEFDGFKIAHLSDIHDKDIRRALQQSLESESLDIIVITGDLIDSKNPDIEQAVDLVKYLQTIAPVYFVTGNHEAWSGVYNRLENKLIETGVHVLANERILIKQGNESILLMGVQDPSFNIESNLLAEESALIEGTLQTLTEDSAAYSILLSHRPELFDVYVRHRIDLIFSGHAHGGQFRLPFIGGLVAPDQGLFPTYTAGIYEEENTQMVVSRGLGNSIIPIRFNNRAEIVLIELQSD